jgi:hypothetical protein
MLQQEQDGGESEKKVMRTLRYASICHTHSILKKNANPYATHGAGICIPTFALAQNHPVL